MRSLTVVQIYLNKLYLLFTFGSFLDSGHLAFPVTWCLWQHLGSFSKFRPKGAFLPDRQHFPDPSLCSLCTFLILVALHQYFPCLLCSSLCDLQFSTLVYLSGLLHHLSILPLIFPTDLIPRLMGDIAAFQRGPCWNWVGFVGSRLFVYQSIWKKYPSKRMETIKWCWNASWKLLCCAHPEETFCW